MLELIALSLSCTAVLHLWFRTSMIMEYGRIPLIRSLLRLKAYIDWAQSKEKVPPYYQWLNETAGRNLGVKGFLARGASCVNCFGMWVAIALCVASGHWELTLAAYALGLWGFHRMGNG